MKNWMRGAPMALIAALAISAVTLCNFAWAQDPKTSKTAANTTNPVTIYRNGRIYTNDPASPWAQALLVRGEEILAVGDDDEVGALADTGAKSVDLEKHFVMPGFNDAHVHIGAAGRDWVAVLA